MKNLKDHMGYIVKYRVHSRVTHQVGDQAWTIRIRVLR